MLKTVTRLPRAAYRNVNRQKRTIITVVNQGFEAYRTTFGKDPTHLKPGLRIALPIIHDVQKVDMREAGMTVEKISAFTKDNVPVQLSAVLFYQVKNAYRACFEVSDYRSAIYSVGTSSLRSIVGRFEYDQIIGDRNRLNKEWLAVVGDSIEQWGVQTTKAEIQSFGPLDASVAKTLEKQMDAERDRRQQELNTRAKINISEGEKQSMILHSEGQLIAARNTADASLITAQKAAEGQRFMIEQETIALVQQLKAVTEQLNNNHSLAVRYLLARRRFDELQAIAKGKNNSTYFINNQTEGVHGLKLFADMQKERPAE